MLAVLLMFAAIAFSFYGLYRLVKMLSKPVVPGGPRVFLSALGNRPVDMNNPKTRVEAMLVGASGYKGTRTVQQTPVNAPAPPAPHGKDESQ